MGQKQLVKTTKRAVYMVSGTDTVGLTASAFYDMGTTEGRNMAANSGITNTSPALSKAIFTGLGAAQTISMGSEVVITGGFNSEYCFERFTIRPTGGCTSATIAAGTGTVIAEFVL